VKIRLFFNLSKGGLAMKDSTRQKWEGRWDQLKGKARKLWGQLTDNELEKAKGDFRQIVGIIKERTGETEEQIEKKLNG
jgi:uncharacterized protein YjbJ (UPF0337 family)